MFKFGSWVLVALAFCILTGYKSQVPDIPVNNIQGLQATKYQKVNPHNPELISVIGVILSKSTNDKGQTNIKLEADDGTPLVITVPPTVNVKVPRAGTRTCIEGQVITPGVISVPNSWNLRSLAPSYKQPKREIVKGEISYVGESSKGVLATITHDETYAESLFIPKSLRVDLSQFGPYVTVIGYRQANGKIYVEEIQ